MPAQGTTGRRGAGEANHASSTAAQRGRSRSGSRAVASQDSKADSKEALPPALPNVRVPVRHLIVYLKGYGNLSDYQIYTLLNDQELWPFWETEDVDAFFKDPSPMLLKMTKLYWSLSKSRDTNAPTDFFPTLDKIKLETSCVGSDQDHDDPHTRIARLRPDYVKAIVAMIHQCQPFRTGTPARASSFEDLDFAGQCAYARAYGRALQDEPDKDTAWLQRMVNVQQEDPQLRQEMLNGNAEDLAVLADYLWTQFCERFSGEVEAGLGWRGPQDVDPKADVTFARVQDARLAMKAVEMKAIARQRPEQGSRLREYGALGEDFL